MPDTAPITQTIQRLARPDVAVARCGAGLTQARRRQHVGGCATVSVVASIVSNFMRTVRFSLAPRVA
ncbi:hypothetical protein HG421_08845 [Xanthomonas campestris pv. badrii]|uniref:Uncharacterized protein n=1 Tax=Xanthomonas campestris pv. badrii TaxID=149696 RepID=A0A7Z2V770_XANCA|nr:hypothetical protein [Xanthomonas campestris]MCC4603639.1 hypothetical protein [Xanthomonas campestris pv. parthenii]QJD66264.1 hypothetical protein HG421_08845 [Xanthomonas campestris pv. badrii]